MRGAMTGDDLLAQLQALPPERRSLPVVCLAHDVGRDRATVNNSAHGKIRLVNVNDDGYENHDGEEPNCIQIMT